MRNAFIRSVILVFVLPLVGGCLGPQYLSARAPTAPLALEEPLSLRGATPQYSRHGEMAIRSEIYSLIVADTFSPYERAKILRAVNEWNVALNGFIRFEIAADGAPPSGPTHQWVITSKQGGRSDGSSTTLAATYAAPGVGGVIDIFIQRIGQRDLGGVVMHELGHVLGLGHTGRGGLMAAHYHPTSQRCVDRATIEAVAAKHALPSAQLNWCEG